MLNPHFDIPFRFTGSLPRATNLCINGGFEKDLTHGWTTSGSPAPNQTRITTDRVFGSCCMQLTSGGASAGYGWMLYPIITGAPITKQAYTLSCYIKGVGATIGKSFSLALNETGGTTASDQNTANGNIILSNTWQRIAISGTIIQTDRTLLYTYCSISAAAAGEIFLTDGVQLELGITATPYIDTNGATASRIGNVGAAVVEQNSFQEIANCVETIIRTPLGFRDDTPDFGFPDLTMLEQPVINKDVVELVQSQEPRSSVLISENPDMIDALIDRITVEVS